MDDWKDEVARLKIVDVAERLGVQVAASRLSPKVALCPFHDDTTPSLRLYEGDNPHYHCFSCQAHGDTVDLVKRRLGLEFVPALDWLKSNFNLNTGPKTGRRLARTPDIYRRALEFWQSRDDGATIKIFAASRQFEVEQLREAGLSVGNVEDFLVSLRADREAEEQAIAVGLAYSGGEATDLAPRSTTLSPFVRGQQLIIPLSTPAGRVVGVMARKLVGEGPKYRFTSGFKKSEILFGADKVRRRIERSKGLVGSLDAVADRLDLFICEGVFDAFRLESVGLAAVSSLGASLSDRQVESISNLADAVSVSGAVLRVHLFYDADKGGRRGISDSLPRLLSAAAENGFLIDVVGIDRPEDEKADPDSLLSGLQPSAAVELVRMALTSPLHALAAVALNMPFDETSVAIEALDAAGSIMLQNRLARRLRGLDWKKVWELTAPDRVSINTDPAPSSPTFSRTFEKLAREAEKSGRQDTIAQAIPVPYSQQGHDPDANLLHALILARESTDSREYPVDVAAWDRIEQAAPLFLPLIADELGHANEPERAYLAHYEAKDSGAPRLKCGPCPEDAVQQQYILTELLRIRPDRRDIAERIPAVRYWSDRQDLVVTGSTKPTSPVSFAYQVDMRALEERPDRHRRRDMFRPFLECWNSFILHIGRRVDRMEGGLVYIARLDIKGFYDHVPRYAIEAILRESLPDIEALDANDIAPLFGARLEGQDRRERLIKWILSHSFGSLESGYCYACPGTGEAISKRNGAKGLPQGPALSAYLANILLFDLDAELERRVDILDTEAQFDGGKKARGGLYARYVDDIIVAARTPDDLRTLRAAIEAKLETLGLELNEKSEHLEAMTPEEARNWVVERRGAGFVAYGEVDDQPSPAADIRASWADIPSLDRRTALNLLYWSAFDDPTETPRPAFEAMLNKISRAEDLRQSDLGNIARRILLRAGLDADAAKPVELGSLVGAFKTQVGELLEGASPAFESRRLRVKSDDRPVAEALVAVRRFSSLLAGLEKLILGNPEANPTFSIEVRVAITRAKANIVSWILNENLLAHFENAFIEKDQREKVREHLGAQLELQIATLEEHAARAMRLRRVELPNNFKVTPRNLGEVPKGKCSEIVRIGWFRTFASSGLPGRDSNNLKAIFHIIAAQVQTISEVGLANADSNALTPQAIAEGVRQFAVRALDSLPLPMHGSDLAVAFLGLAGVDVEVPNMFRMRAIASFIGLSNGPNRAQALAGRPALINSFANGSEIIPLPPIANQPGIFCFDPNARNVRAIIVMNGMDIKDHLPEQLTWTKAEDIGGLSVFVAPLPEGVDFLLNPQTKVRDDLGTIAALVDGLVRSHINRDSPQAPLVHVFGLIGPRNVDVETSTPYFCLCWKLERQAIEHLVFERRGNSVAVQRAPHVGADLWRIGQSVADLFSIAEEVENDGGIRKDRTRLEDRLKRMVFSRLKGRWINGAQVAAAHASKEMPKAITRVINALKEISESGDGFGPLALEFLLSGRVMRTRINLTSTVEVPGAWARFIELLGLQTLANGDDEGLFDQPAVRAALSRPERALIRAGEALSDYANRTEVESCKLALQITALGFELAAFRGELRDFVLASLAQMSTRDLDRLSSVRPNLSMFGSYGAAVLVEPRFSGSDTDASAYDLAGQSDLLFPTLMEAIELSSLPGRAKLERISTAGWLVIACVICGAVDFEMSGSVGSVAAQARPAFFTLSVTAMAAPLRQLGLDLLTISVNDQDLAASTQDVWPWEVASAINQSALRDGLTDARDALGAIAVHAGVVKHCNPLPLRSLRYGDPSVEFVDADGAQYSLPWWRCSLTTTIMERADRVETRATSNNRLVTPYSALTDNSGNILVVQLVSESLSRVTGLENSSPETQEKQVEQVLETTSKKAPAEPTLAALPADPPQGAPLGQPSPAEVAAEPAQPSILSASKFSILQRALWEKRGKNAGVEKTGYGRVAILQYDFADSYFPERPLEYRIDNTKIVHPRIMAHPVDWRLSFEEHRRRRVLTEVLSCCHAFQVEALVLPEYSVRPETVNWMQRHCKQKGYKTSIWAGTFRQQEGFELKFSSDWDEYVPMPTGTSSRYQSKDAVLSVLFRETQAGGNLTFSKKGTTQNETPIFNLKLPDKLETRKKKYPSIGMHEDFRPSKEELKPLMSNSRSIKRIESFIIELICSELFVFNGPLNWNNFVEHLEASCERYNVEPGKWIETLIHDAKTIADVFSGRGEHKPRRTLLFLPCATSRDVDYHYFAQSAYLASGIVTAFCNSSRSPALGGSCFIGASGWESRDAPQITSPYHGAAPGILSTSDPDRGVLGKKENALVIADIRPDRTVEDRPRSQTLGPPMRLIAHIPISEGHLSAPADGKWDRGWWHEIKTGWLTYDAAQQSLLEGGNHKFLLHQTAASKAIDFKTFSENFKALLSKHKGGNTAQLAVKDRKEVIAAALSLANFFSASPGMSYRAKMMATGLQAHPEAFPCPALTDWMVVDLGLDEFEQQLRELKALKSETAADLLTGNLRDAAWHWVEPHDEN